MGASDKNIKHSKMDSFALYRVLSGSHTSAVVDSRNYKRSETIAPLIAVHYFVAHLLSHKEGNDCGVAYVTWVLLWLL